MNTDKLKEETLGLSFYPHECGSMIDCVTKQDALKAMDTHAEQISILFGEWILKEAILSRDVNWFDAGKHYTTKQLFPLFIKHLNEQQAIDADTLEK